MNDTELFPHPNAQAKLLLVPCTDPTCQSPYCPNHGYVVLELGGQKQVMGEAKTRVQAYGHLKTFKTAPGVSPQPDYLTAVRTADFLTGEMPSALFTPAGTRPGDKRGKLAVVPMDAQVVNAVMRARGQTSQEDRYRMNRLREVFSR